MKVYVLNQIGKPLMPCSCGKARRLLKDGKAKIVRKDIFTIQLLYRNNSYKQDVTLGIDAGSKYVGLSASTKKQELFSGEMQLRTDIKKLLSDRATLRRDRRIRNTRYRKARFDNRKASRKKGSLTPSIRQKVQSHLNIVSTLLNVMPITSIIIEVASFDIQKIKNPEITGEEYQKGEQVGFGNVREYVLFRDNHTCQYCMGKSRNNILQVHHIESRKTGGDAPSNLITLCKTCHQAYHKGKIQLKVNRGESFRDTSVMNAMKRTLAEELRNRLNNVQVTFGYITKYWRVKLGISKEHYNDAFCIANNLNAKRLNKVYRVRCVARHSRILHVQQPGKGGKRRSLIPSKWLKDSHFTRFDTVLFNGKRCFISGSSNGYAYLRDIYWNKIEGCKTKITTKKLKLITHCKGSVLIF